MITKILLKCLTRNCSYVKPQYEILDVFCSKIPYDVVIWHWKRFFYRNIDFKRHNVSLPMACSILTVITSMFLSFPTNVMFTQIDKNLSITFKLNYVVIS